MLVKVTLEYMAHVSLGGNVPGVGGGHPDNSLPQPPTYFPGRPDQGLPPVLGWPVDPGYGHPIGGRPDNSLPIGGGHPDNSLPGGGHVSPPIFYPGHPENGLPPIVGWPVDPGFGNPGGERPTPPIYIPGDGVRPPTIGWPLPPAPVRPDNSLPGERPVRPDQGLPPAPARPDQGLPPTAAPKR